MSILHRTIHLCLIQLQPSNTHNNMCVLAHNKNSICSHLKLARKLKCGGIGLENSTVFGFIYFNLQILKFKSSALCCYGVILS